MHRNTPAMRRAAVEEWTPKPRSAIPERGGTRPYRVREGPNGNGGQCPSPSLGSVPLAIANAAYKRQKHNPGVTEVVKIPNRGHSLTIDHGWHQVAETTLDFVRRFA